MFEGDYLALNGLRVKTLHRVVTNTYTLSITWRVQKPVKQRGVRCVSRIVVPSEGVDAKELSEVKQAIDETKQGQSILSQQLKHTLNKLAATRKPKEQ